MSSIGLNAGLKALLASQAALDTIGHNVSNSTTPGYSRQRLELNAARSLRYRGLTIGGGVNADVVTRTTNQLLQVRTVGQISSLHRLGSAIGGMTEVEALLGEPGGFGLSGGMSDLFTSFAELSTSTEDLVLRTGVVEKATALTSQFNQLAINMRSLRFDTASQVSLQTKQVNSLADQLVLLNLEIAGAEVTGVPANDLRDQREEKIRQLATHVDIDFHEDSSGVIRINAGGRLLVGGNRAFEMSAVTRQDGSVELFIEGSDIPVEVRQGELAGLQRVGETFIPDLQGQFDELARNLILEMNRVHSTGTPAAGHFQSLTSAYAAVDSDFDGVLTDELLNRAGYPFAIQSGELVVNLTRLDDGTMESHRVEIDEYSTTVGDLLDALGEIPGLNATLNSSGRMQIFADAGFGFDFAPKLDPRPDRAGTMGGGGASLGAGSAGPYALSDGVTLDLTGPVGPFSITFAEADFTEISEATAEELAAVLNADSDMQANGLRAVVVDERLYLQSVAVGSSAGFSVDSGTALSALGWTAATAVTGHDTSVEVEVGGTFTGGTNGHFMFIPQGDGIVGTTPNLAVDVFDANGQLLTTLDLGENYQPGTEIEVGAGITVKFGYGELSATNNDSFRLDLINDSDTSDVLAAMGINSFFVGTGADDIAIQSDLDADPSRLAAGTTGAAGDNRALLAMMDLQSQQISGLGGETLGDYYGSAISDVGFEISTADNARNVEAYLLQSLEQRREQVSGVNVDEEMVNMIRFEQSYSAAARYIQVLNDLHDDLLSLI